MGQMRVLIGCVFVEQKWRFLSSLTDILRDDNFAQFGNSKIFDPLQSLLVLSGIDKRRQEVIETNTIIKINLSHIFSSETAMSCLMLLKTEMWCVARFGTICTI